MGRIDAAALGVKRAPAVVYSWVDMAPDSEYLRGLYYRERDGARRRLPDHVRHHLLIRIPSRPEPPGDVIDKVVSVASELRAEAQDEATRRTATIWITRES